VVDSQLEMAEENVEIEREISEPETILEVSKLNFYYGNFRALTNISMKIFRNSITAIIGPSGCGKSTFLRCFNRMNELIGETRVEGEILMTNRDISRH